MKLKTLLTALFLFGIFDTVYPSNEVIRGCSVGSNKKGTSARNNITLDEFSHNNPKKNEVFRFSLMFPWKRPVLGITGNNSSLNYYFGKTFFRNLGNIMKITLQGDVGDNQFAIYGSHQDWIHRRKPCDKVKSSIFESSSFVEMEFVLALSGKFSVFAYGEQGFVLSCPEAVNANVTGPYSLDIGYAGDSKHKFYYDCPRKLTS